MPHSNASVDIPVNMKQKLTEDELLVLNSHLEDWKAAAGKEKKELQRSIIKEAKKHAPKMDARALKNRKSVSTPVSSDFIN
jgi:hypothetical protein